MRRVLLTLMALSACRDKTPEPSPPPSAHDGVTLLQSGVQPLQLLRYHLTKGEKTASELMYDLEVKNDDQSGPMPTLVVEMETEVEDLLASGAAQLRVTVTGASVRDREGSQVSNELMQAQAASLRGVVITEALSPDGEISGARVAVSAGSGKASSQLDGLLHSLEHVAMRLPADPVGVGATWRERRTLPEGGIRAVSEITYTLRELGDGKIAYLSTGQSTGAPQTIEQDGVKVDVVDTRGHSMAHGSVDLSRYALDTTATSTFAATMTVVAPDAGPGAQRSTVEITMTIRVAPSRAPAGGTIAGSPEAEAPVTAAAPGDAAPPSPPSSGSAVDDDPDHGAHSAP